MREILFRGKDCETREWLTGYFVQQKNFIGGIHSCIFQNFSEENRWEMKRVRLETVGQYTGHKDDTGKRIFEGDIVNFTDGTSTESGFWETCCCGKVGYDEEEACFYVSNRLSAESWEVLDECHIIGNIFDNPELLEQIE